MQDTRGYLWMGDSVGWYTQFDGNELLKHFTIKDGFYLIITYRVLKKTIIIIYGLALIMV